MVKLYDLRRAEGPSHFKTEPVWSGREGGGVVTCTVMIGHIRRDIFFSYSTIGTQ